MVMLSFAEALALANAEATPTSRVQLVSLSDALHRVPSRPYVSPVAVPAHATSIKDGYAVRAPIGGSSLRLAFSIAAGATEDRALGEGECAYITTGGALPSNANAVVEVEATSLQGGDVVTFANPDSVRAGLDVRQVGSDVAQSEMVVPAGMALAPSEVGLLAMAGVSNVLVYERPVVAVFSTGNELVAPGSTPRRGQVFDCNLPLLAAAARELGCVVHELGVARDDEAELERRLARAESLGCDAVVVSGGVSEGRFDFVRPLLERRGRVLFSKVSTKPGKPVTFAVLPRGAASSPPLLVFALPGNPSSALVMFTALVAPVLRRIAGHARPEAKRVPVVLAHDVVLDAQRPEFQRATLRGTHGQLEAATTGVQRSSRLLSALGADVVLDLPQGHTMARGSTVSALLLRDLRYSAGLSAAGVHRVALFATRAVHAAVAATSLNEREWAVLDGVQVVDVDGGLVDRLARARLRDAGASVAAVFAAAREASDVRSVLEAAGFKHVPGVGEQVRATVDVASEDECFISRHGGLVIVTVGGPSPALHAALRLVAGVCDLVAA